jgi:hypothetical protein
LAAAKGDVLTFISADDFYTTSTVLSIAAAAFLKPSPAEIFIGRTPRLITRAGVSYTFDPDLPGILAGKVVRHLLSFQHCSVFADAAFVRRHGLTFDTTFTMCGDWDWAVRALAASRRVRYTKAPLGCWRMHSEQASLQQAARSVKEAHLVCFKHGSSYLANRACKTLIGWYALAVNAAALRRTVGTRTFAGELTDWLRKRLSRPTQL